MRENEGVRIVNIFDNLDTESIEAISNDISGFRSRDNEDVENFLKRNAIHFCRLKQAITYLVYGADEEFLAYFTLAFKIVDLPMANISGTLQKQLERYGRKSGDMIQIPCVLLAQWSKNYAVAEKIDGSVLLGHIRSVLLQVQRLVGGSFMFLECEAEKERLVERYKALGFLPVSGRLSNENKPLVQFIKKI